MLINLRNALMSGKRLPYDAEVEFLATTGGQYINTGIIGSSATKVEITAYSTNTTDYMSLFGARNVNNSNRPSYSIWQRSSVAGDMRMRFDYNSASADSLAGGEWNASTVNTITKDNVLNYIDGTLASANTARSFSLDIPFYLGAINGSGTPATYYFVGRIYSCKLWDENGVLVRDYIPVRVGQVGYLYDRVTGKLFGNAGTGDFVLGPDVVPVEYIESQSNYAQIIDTGFYANQNTKALITFEKLGADGWLFGSRNVSSSATDKFGIFAYQSPDGKISAQVGNVYIEPIISGGLTNRKRTIELSLSDGVIVDGETIATFSESQKSQTFTSTYPMALFNMRVSSSGFNSGIYCRVYAYQIFENGLIVRSFLPVRVGTDATSWEGAMMDVLTRRIYRNAGTGAFTYGNDLKYPIPSE